MVLVRKVKGLRERKRGCYELILRRALGKL